MLEGARMNMAILDHAGTEQAGIGSALAKHNGHGSLSDKIKEVAGAASDLRMSGGDVAVMSSAGSGNHGIVAVIPVAMTAQGPHLDQVARPVAGDAHGKGSWCVPTYSNPGGVTVTVDGTKPEPTGDESTGIYSFSVDFPAILEQWKADHPTAGTTGTGLSGSGTTDGASTPAA